MKLLYTYIIILCTIAGLSVKATAQNRDSVSSIVQKFHISYPKNDTEVHYNYLNNARNLRIIQEYFNKSPRIDSIVIYSYSSPEGPYKVNERLAKERGERARRYLLEHLPAEREFHDSLIVINDTAENWEGLFEMVNNCYPYEDKQDVIDLLQRDGISNDRRKALLAKLNGGRPWEYIQNEILPQLRYATWVAEWVHVITIADTIPAMPPIKYVPVPTQLKPLSALAKDTVIEKNTIFALKSNLLYDLVSFANFAVEVPLYKDKISLLYYHQFPWWTWGKANNEYCARFLSIGGEARLWFNTKDKLQGHSIGIYSESGKYDFQFQKKICYQGEFYSAGLSYSYAMPIGKRLNMEFSISAGYASIAYRGYTPSDDYEILWRDPEKVGRLHYLGPTKAQITLVLPIKKKKEVVYYAR